MKNLIFGLMAIGLTSLCFSQNKSNGIAEVQLEGVVISASNYSYLMNVLEENTCQRVKHLELEAAKFDIRDAKNYDPNFETIQVVFSQSNGKIIAVYDNDGEIIKSYERFKDVALPPVVLSSIYKNDHHGWQLKKDIYQVFYQQGEDVKKIYKVQLRKGKLKKNLTIDADGNFI